MSYPDRRRVEAWYRTAREGISNLAGLLTQSTSGVIADAIHDEIFGMTQTEWKAFHDEKQEDHEVAASLALLATCEGAIRRDLEQRIAHGGLHHTNLKPLIEPARHVSIIFILQKWRKAIGKKSHAYKHIGKLEDIYINSRNALAHGRAMHGEFTFNLLLEHLNVAERKWKDAVADFKGF